jgi:hypothetical protein
MEWFEHEVDIELSEELPKVLLLLYMNPITFIGSAHEPTFP